MRGQGENMNGISEIARLKTGRRTKRISSYDVSGRNADYWKIPAGQARVLADIKGPACINHLWMTQANHYRECLIRITFEESRNPSILVPLGDFFCLGHGIVNSFQSLYFTASTRNNNRFNIGCALNCYLPMFFRKRAVVELVNESEEEHLQYFYVDYEELEEVPETAGYLHAEFRRTNPFGGWGHEVRVNSPEADIVNKERMAWENNYLILETKGRGHFIGCNLSVSNFQGTWWGEGDDMIWVDGYKWPPDLHGTGSEDFLNQAWGMQENAFLRNGSSIHELKTGGYQTSYIFYPENPVRFEKEIRVSIEHGHGNHLANEMSSVAYWYAEKPAAAARPPAVARRLPVGREQFTNRWVQRPGGTITPFVVKLNGEMKRMKEAWRKKMSPKK